MSSLRGIVSVLLLLFLQWDKGNAQSFTYYFRPGPNSPASSFSLGNPSPFTGFAQQAPTPPFNGNSPPRGSQYYTYGLPGGNEEPQQHQSPRVINQPIQYYQPQQPEQNRHVQQPYYSTITQQEPQQPQPQQIQYIQQQQPQLQSQQQHQPQHQTQPQLQHLVPSPQALPQFTPIVPATPTPFSLNAFYNRPQPTFASSLLNSIGNVPSNRVVQTKTSAETKDSSEKPSLAVVSPKPRGINGTVLTYTVRTEVKSVQPNKQRVVVEEEESEEESSSEEIIPAEPPKRVHVVPAISRVRLTTTTTSTTTPIPTTIRPTSTPAPVTSATTAEESRPSPSLPQFVNASPSPITQSPYLQNPNQFPTPSVGAPFLPNQFSPQTQQFLPTQFAQRDPYSLNEFPNQNSQFPPNPFSPQNQFAHQFPQQPNDFPNPEQYFPREYPSPDPPRPVQVLGRGQEDSQYPFRPFPSEIPEIENNSSGEIENQLGTTTFNPSSPSPSPIPLLSTSTLAAVARGQNFYKFATPSGLYDQGTASPLQQYSQVEGNNNEAELKSSVRRGRKRIRVNRNRFQQLRGEGRIIEPVSQSPNFAVTPQPEDDDVTTYRSKFRFVSRPQAATTRRPEIESNINDNNDNSNTGESAQAAIDRRLQTLQRQIRFKTNNKHNDNTKRG